MRVLVTGANGFIGSHVCRLLAAGGHQVRALTRPGAVLELLTDVPVELAVGDVTVPASLPPALAGVDAVVHLAGVTEAARDETFEQVNHRGALNLGEAAVAAGISRFVFASSLSAQGPSKPGRPHEDAGEEAPINAYGRSKVAAERDLAALPLTLVTIRPCVVYGPGDRELLTWLKLLRLRVVPVVPGFALSLIHVNDAAAAFAEAATGTIAAGTYFLSDGQPTTLDGLLDGLERAVGGPPALRVPLSPALLRGLAPLVEGITRATGIGQLAARTTRELAAGAWTCLPTRLTEGCGFVPAHNLDAGLSQTVAWYRAQGWL